MIRPLSNTDLHEIADYLDGSNRSLSVAVSVLGFDPEQYRMSALRDWLYEETGIFRNFNSTWTRTEQ